MHSKKKNWQQAFFFISGIHYVSGISVRKLKWFSRCKGDEKKISTMDRLSKEEELRSRIRVLESKLEEAKLKEPRCSEAAFAAHVEGRVKEEVAKERARWEVKWALREAEWNRALCTMVSLPREVGLKVEEDPLYASFLKMSQRGRRKGRYLASAY